MAAALATGVLGCGLAGPAQAQPRPEVTLAVIPPATTVAELATVPRLALGVMSAGIGEVPAEQTYLDISQGNRLANSLYDAPLSPNWARLADRADSAPADLVPGLLGSTLLAAGVPARADPSLGAPSLMVVDRDGRVDRGLAGPGVTVRPASVGSLSSMATTLRGDDLLIAFAAASPRVHGALPIGIAGSGFDGNLTSDSTRTDGYLLSTDIAPTILRRFGVPIPGAMDGQPIRSEGSADAAAIEDRASRMEAIPDRRAPVLILSLVAWVLVALLVGLASPRLRRTAFAWLALAFAYMPLILLAGALIEPGPVAEGLLVALGAAACAALTVALTRGWWALAIACAITVTAYGIDVIVGSPLTKVSLLGPNPIFGVRFYGIGNELEALLAVMVPTAVGAGLSAKSGWGRPVGVGAFLGAAAVTALVFGAGRFGADVGAVIVLPVGAAVAALTLPTSGSSRPKRRRARLIAAMIGAPFIAVVVLALVDLVSGANAHLARSVLDAGGAGDLADVAERRLELSVQDFTQAAGNPLFWIVVVGIGAAIWQWRRIDAWLLQAPAARAGLFGACAAVGVGMLVNDSGATFLALGAIALAASVTFAWAQASNP